MLCMKRENKEYLEWLQSDDVVDEVVYGRCDYPVVDLCKQGEFGLAHDMLKKGYRCIHGNDAEDVSKILRSVLTKNQKITNNEEMIPYILEKLATELAEMESEEYSQLLSKLGANIAKNTYCFRSLLIFSIMRNSLPELYQSLVACNIWNAWQLMMFETEFVKDHIAYLKNHGCLNVVNYMEGSDEEKQMSDAILLTLLRIDDVDLLKQCTHNIFRIFSDCFEVRPRELACDIAIISAMKEMSLVAAALPEYCPQLGTELFTTNSGISEILQRLEFRLRINMRKSYNLEHVNKIIEEYRKDNFFVDYDENVEYCADYIFDEVKRYCHGM